MPRIHSLGGHCASGGTALCEEACLHPGGILQERGSSCPESSGVHDNIACINQPARIYEKFVQFPLTSISVSLFSS